VIERLLPSCLLCLRERFPLPARYIDRLPNLNLIASTDPGNASIDVVRIGDSMDRSGSYGVSV